MFTNFEKELVIINHHKLWTWLAKEQLKRNNIVEKKDYFVENNKPRVYQDCYLCKYKMEKFGNTLYCKDCCPVVWDDGEWKGFCVVMTSENDRFYRYGLFNLWSRERNHTKRAFLALKIANLPKRQTEV